MPSQKLDWSRLTRVLATVSTHARAGSVPGRCSCETGSLFHVSSREGVHRIRTQSVLGLATITYFLGVLCSDLSQTDKKKMKKINRKRQLLFFFLASSRRWMSLLKAIPLIR